MHVLIQNYKWNTLTSFLKRGLSPTVSESFLLGQHCCWTCKGIWVTWVVANSLSLFSLSPPSSHPSLFLRSKLCKLREPRSGVFPQSSFPLSFSQLQEIQTLDTLPICVTWAGWAEPTPHPPGQSGSLALNATSDKPSSNLCLKSNL